MQYREFQENLETISNLMDKLPTSGNEQTGHLIKSYLEQNLLLLNDILHTSILNLQKLQRAKTANDVICTQAIFTNEINQRLSLSTQRFLNASLGQIADYNEWLKAHCDSATD